MALTSAQLSAAITASQTQNIGLTNIIAPAGGSALPALGATPTGMGVPMLIDTEFVFVTAQTAAGVFSIRSRGSEGTAASAHDVLANCYVSAQSSDFGNPQPGTVVTIDPAEDMAVSIGQDGTIPLSGANTIFNINKATAAALVLPAASQADNGVSIVLTSNTAAAHVVTTAVPGNVQDGTLTAKNTLTFAAAKGATIVLVGENGFWNVQGTPINVTLS